MKSPKSPYRQHKQQWSRHAPLVGITVLVTLAASNLLGGQLPGIPQGAAAQRQEDQQGLYLSQGADGHGQQDDGWTVPQWQLPVEWRQKVVAAIPLSSEGLPWIKASRAWRRGIRTAFVADFQPFQEVVQEGKRHGEDFVFLNTTGIPFDYYGKAAMVPSMAAQHFGDSYEWLLYGDDDTVWFMDSVLDIISKLDPQQPHFITDHFWFWRQEVDHGPVHPGFDAPRCVPCGFNKSGIDTARLGFDPPHACPSCSVAALCAADTRKDLYTQDCSSFRLRYPQREKSVPETEGEFTAHGGAGVILSVGLLRMLSPSYMLDCIRTQFTEPGMVHGGDTLFSHCTFYTGVAPTDPGFFIRDLTFATFDPGSQNVRNVMDLMYAYTKRMEPTVPIVCCDAQCEERLRWLATVHLRGLHFKEPEAAMMYMRQLVELRDLYLSMRGRATGSGHSPVPPSWDNYKVCA
ncbi:hypothetical protein N2152v2_009837 [Parachlorella kessleri]